jgi:hypothetical protein
MKIVIVRDRKTRKTDLFKYYESGPLPPMVNPPDPGEPKDEIPSKLKKKIEDEKKKIN